MLRAEVHAQQGAGKRCPTHLQVLRHALDGLLEALFGVLHVALQAVHGRRVQYGG